LIAAVFLGACGDAVMKDWQAAYDTGMLSYHDPPQQVVLLKEAKRLADSTKDVDVKVKSNDALAVALTRTGAFQEAVKVRLDNVSLLKSDTARGADLAVAYAQLAMAYDDAKQVTSALEAANKGWEVSLTAKPSLTKQQKAELLMGRGMAEAMSGDNHGAADIQAALKIHKDLWGADDVRVLSDTECLALAYQHTGDIDKAIDTEHKVIDARERLFQDWDPSCYKSLQLYLDLLELGGRKAEAQAVDDKLTKRLAEFTDYSPMGLKSGADVNVHGYYAPVNPDLKAPRAHLKKS
jgi:tetratricopeptide (TPR) repeat protein